MEDIERLIEIIDNSKLLIASMDEDELAEETNRLCLSVRFRDKSQAEEFFKVVDFIESAGLQMGIDPDSCWREVLIPSLRDIYSSFGKDDAARKDFSERLTELMPGNLLCGRDILQESAYMDSLLTEAIEIGDERMIEWLASEWCEWYMAGQWPEGIFGAAMLHELLKTDVEPESFTNAPVRRYAATLGDNASPAIKAFVENTLSY